MTPEERARQLIDARLEQSGWISQDLCSLNPMASIGVVAIYIDSPVPAVAFAGKLTNGLPFQVCSNIVHASKQ